VALQYEGGGAEDGQVFERYAHELKQVKADPEDDGDSGGWPGV
jgi:hypothetical protein